MSDLLMTTGEAAKYLHRSPDRVRQLEREQKLPAQRTKSGVRLFKVSDVDRFARKMTGRAAKSEK